MHARTLLPDAQIMVIPDATKDSRFCDNPNVTAEGGVRCYVGAPLVASNGHRIGTL
jgi:GAF domain-containing protein